MSIKENSEVVEEKPKINRAEMYTFGELYRAFRNITVPGFVWKMILCSDPVLTLIYMFMGLYVLDVLTRYTLVQLVGVVSLTLLAHGIAYTAIRPHLRLLPYENVMDVRRADLTVSPEVVALVVRYSTNWINRWVATVQFLLFGPYLVATILVKIALLEVYNAFRWLELSTLIKFAYCMAFVLPRICRVFCLWLDSQPPNGHVHWLIRKATTGRRLFLEALKEAIEETLEEDHDEDSEEDLTEDLEEVFEDTFEEAYEEAFEEAINGVQLEIPKKKKQQPVVGWIFIGRRPASIDEAFIGYTQNTDLAKESIEEEADFF
ncbi:uncharacterized protein LOC108143948 [Drosophila elegans]|uniref:uncharacterized protein LOC108143948 n=1 Tax=Drosophila elegans TaxID=30023 RepID=UPI001BC86904|nr:uncharacterized protein LOC108143948 [Drosophila elegans]